MALTILEYIKVAKGYETGPRVAKFGGFGAAVGRGTGLGWLQLIL